jgi:hypothetical protein
MKITLDRFTLLSAALIEIFLEPNKLKDELA